MDSILELMVNIEKLSPEWARTIKEHVSIKNVKKGAILQRKGDKNIRGFFVKKGLLRSYTIDEKGKEHIFMFAPEGWIISDLESITESAPATLFVDCLEDSEIEVVDRRLIERLHDFPKELLQNDNDRLIRRVAVLQRRVLLLMSASAQERYEEFLKTYPQIVQRVPLRMIASYLGMTPEALSKIRSKIARS